MLLVAGYFGCVKINVSARFSLSLPSLFVFFFEKKFRVGWGKRQGRSEKP